MAVILRLIVALRKGHRNCFFRLSTAVTVRKGPDASNQTSFVQICGERSRNQASLHFYGGRHGSVNRVATGVQGPTGQPTTGCPSCQVVGGSRHGVANAGAGMAHGRMMLLERDERTVLQSLGNRRCRTLAFGGRSLFTRGRRSMRAFFRVN
jgi:hypothetical protein